MGVLSLCLSSFMQTHRSYYLTLILLKPIILFLFLLQLNFLFYVLLFLLFGNFFLSKIGREAQPGMWKSLLLSSRLLSLFIIMIMKIIPRNISDILLGINFVFAELTGSHICIKKVDKTIINLLNISENQKSGLKCRKPSLQYLTIQAFFLNDVQKHDRK